VKDVQVYNVMVFIGTSFLLKSRDSAVSIATGYRVDGQGSSPDRIKNVLFSMLSRSVLGPTRPAVQWVRGAVFTGAKRPERESDHSLPTGAEVKKTLIYVYTSTLPYAFIM
jgi:hypothetical protein